MKNYGKEVYATKGQPAQWAERPYRALNVLIRYLGRRKAGKKGGELENRGEKGVSKVAGEKDTYFSD
jgi:hypothetical protein